jgi:hypothetical protein
MVLDVHGQTGETLRQHLVKPMLPDETPGTGDLRVKVNLHHNTLIIGARTGDEYLVVIELKSSDASGLLQPGLLSSSGCLSEHRANLRFGRGDGGLCRVKTVSGPFDSNEFDIG